ncbi:uncharacterized protein M421DRAFT_342930 [Didymella exigua CBS 183.55]|uniref:Uncharacterized protein n=1 Tax=Didymella exigua CBS 183.55 TaxID=1150837 RepID=A0A6A5S179_9PLEO|nr:uncharacterized protein M421DRAFT_342930 [Didymella exigua CBS 183.55]KAF1931267.1 hypothetical protein M421DRAFT_342930 [Didymella exigua CBS 183.55]
MLKTMDIKLVSTLSVGEESPSPQSTASFRVEVSHHVGGLCLPTGHAHGNAAHRICHRLPRDHDERSQLVDGGRKGSAVGQPTANLPRPTGLLCRDFCASRSSHRAGAEQRNPCASRDGQRMGNLTRGPGGLRVETAVV